MNIVIKQFVVYSLMLAGLVAVMGCDEYSRLERRAKKGDPVAMRELGLDIWRHTSGRGDEVKVALGWLQKAAEKGDLQAMYELASIHDMGNTNNPEALYWFRKGAAAGDRFCCVKMGEAYRFGKWGLPIDVAKSDRWFEAAAREKRKAEGR